MTEKDILRAMSGIDAALILSADPATSRKKSNWRKWTAIAACFIVAAFVAVGYYNVVLRGANATGPVILDYASFAEAGAAIGKDILYNDENTSFAESGIGSVSISCFEDENGSVDVGDPNQLKARVNQNGIRVSYYILFGRDDVKKSYVGGYEEQKLRREIGGVTVHYSKIYDGAYHSQAKFIHGGNLYIIDVTSNEDTHEIMDYIDRILTEE
jgi:hypothetical protein